MYCEKCGLENDEDAKFCENCGSKLKQEPLTQRPVNQPKKGWSTTSQVLIIGIVILIVILGATIGVLLKSNINPIISTNNTNNTESTAILLTKVPELAQAINQTGVNFTTIKFEGVTLDKNQCLYITARAIVMLNKGETGNIPINQYKNPDNPYGTNNSANITKNNYVNMAQRTTTWMNKYDAAPNYVGISNPKAPGLSTYNVLKLFTKVLTGYKKTGKLPPFIQIP